MYYVKIICICQEKYMYMAEYPYTYLYMLHIGTQEMHSKHKFLETWCMLYLVYTTIVV